MTTANLDADPEAEILIGAKGRVAIFDLQDAPGITPSGKRLRKVMDYAIPDGDWQVTGVGAADLDGQLQGIELAISVDEPDASGAYNQGHLKVFSLDPLSWIIMELDSLYRQGRETLLNSMEIGDLDGDGTPEIWLAEREELSYGSYLSWVQGFTFISSEIAAPDKREILLPVNLNPNSGNAKIDVAEIRGRTVLAVLPATNEAPAGGNHDNLSIYQWNAETGSVALLVHTVIDHAGLAVLTAIDIEMGDVTGDGVADIVVVGEVNQGIRNSGRAYLEAFSLDAANTLTSVGTRLGGQDGKGKKKAESYILHLAIVPTLGGTPPGCQIP